MKWKVVIKAVKSKLIVLFLFIILVVLLVFAFNKTKPYVYQMSEHTDDGIQTASLGQVGIDANTLSKAIDRINNKTYKNIHSILIIRDGKLVFEEYFSGRVYKHYAPNHHGKLVHFDRDTIHYLASVTKSFTSALVGIAIDQGYIKDVNERIFSYFPEYSHLKDDNKDKITIKHLLTMSSGFQWNEKEYKYSDGRNDVIRLLFVPDPIEYILTKRVIYEPGTRWYYSGGDVNLLAEIIKRASGLPMEDFAEKYLFGPLEITQFKWYFINSNLVSASGGLNLRPRDMAKFGLLYLQDGRWNGKQIISKEWIEESTQKHIDIDHGSHKKSHKYGYQWRLKTYHVNSRPLKAVIKKGWGGQAVVLFPELNLLIVFTGGNYVSRDPSNEIVARYILPAVLNSK
ncbi:MAG: serine hydrolase domain-containing protein [Planctomycetota bacterium]|jgi:CubicO group peptidase (beta-lactamase class C family)